LRPRPIYSASKAETKNSSIKQRCRSPHDRQSAQSRIVLITSFAERKQLAELDLACHRIAKFDKWAIAQTKRLVNTSLPADVELGAGWDACIASLGRPAAQDGIKALMARGFHKPGDVENRLGYYLGEIAR
jgi:hypothetical protein